MIYSVISKATGQEVHRYASGGIVEDGYPIADFDHLEYTEAPASPAARTLTTLEYLRRFTAQERITIRAVAAQNPVLADYVALMEQAEEINTGDPDTVAAVQMLEQAGLIAAGRAAEVLYGQ